MQTPWDTHWNAAMHILKYLKTYPNKGLIFATNNNFSLIVYADSG